MWSVFVFAGFEGALLMSDIITRRGFIKTTAAAASLAVAGESMANPEYARDMRKQQDLADLANYDILLPRVKFASDRRVTDHWNSHPRADRNLLRRLSEVIRCKVKDVRFRGAGLGYAKDSDFNTIVTFDDTERICRFPMLFMTSEGYYKFNGHQKQSMKTYLERGGFLIMDDCIHGRNADYFYRSSMSLLTEIFGNDAVQSVSRDHEVFHNVFDLGDTGLPWCNGQNHGAKGLFLDNRLAAFLSSTDIHCGWTDDTGQFYGRNGRGPGHSGHDKAIEMGVNLLMYAMSH